MVEVPDHLKTQDMCYEVVRIEPTLLGFVPDCFKTEEMWDEAVRKWPSSSFIPDYLRMQETPNETRRAIPDAFHWISERFATHTRDV